MDTAPRGQEYRIFGPPGTGKTTYLSAQVKRAAEERGSDQVMIASFTRTAAQELAGRNLPVDRSQVATLHSHAYRAIGGGVLADEHVDGWNQAYPEFALSDGKRSGKASLDEMVLEEKYATEADAIYMEYQTNRARMLPRPMYKSITRRFADAWDDWKRQSGYIDFTDMIELALTNTTAAPGHPSIGFFDEFQDFTPLEIALVRHWASQMDVYLVAGDDDQCIYQFKGASPAAFLNPDLDPEYKRVLPQSHRVPRSVQAIADRWIRQLTIRETKEYKPRDEEGEVVRSSIGYQFPDMLINDASKYLDQGMSVMFLATCGYMVDPIRKTLKDAGIPFHNPYRRSRGDWNPLTPSRGIAAKDRLLAYLRPDPAVWGDQARMWTAEDVRTFTDVLKAKGVLVKGAKSMIDVVGTAGELPVERVMSWFEPDAFERLWDGDIAWFADHLLASRRDTMQFPLQVARTRGAGELREDPRVVIGTIHSVKGGEADVVYLFPDLSVAGMKEWVSHDRRESVIRQMYVGMTRAKHTLVICGASTPYHVTGF